VPADAAVEELAGLLGARVVADPDGMAGYLRDQCLLADAGVPRCVVRAESHDDVVATVAWASQHGVPIVTRGAGTGLTGAANALDGCVVLSVAGLNQIIEIDPAGRTARVQAGVLNGDLDALAAVHDLAYLPDPGSKAISSIGGNVATNAGGMCCVKHGVTRDHVAELVVVLADGRVLRTGSRTRKDVTGLDLTSLLIGSEGTLGVITEVTVWLHPRPAATSTVVGMFATVEAAVGAVVALTRLAVPAAAELMDAVTVAAVNELTGMGIDAAAGAVLLLRFDGGTPQSVTREGEEAEELLSAHGASEVYRTDDLDEGDALMEARRVALTALERQGATLLDDVAVPVHRLPDLVEQITRIARRHDVTIATFGHAADGNMHPTVVFDAADVNSVRRARAAFEEILDLAVGLGGVLSGEHGIGSLKHPAVRRHHDGVALDVMAAVKRAFDPEGILNPGRSY
jgi:glycolate oxidase